MTKSQRVLKRRYSPEVRRSMILDQTAEIIARDGVAGVTMEGICREADISKSLFYTYFDGLTELLKELLLRELKSLRRQQIAATKESSTFEELVRNITHVYLNYISERGLIIERLQADSNVTDLIDPTYYGRTAVIDNLTPMVAKLFGMPADIARATIDISFGLPAAAGEFLLRGEMDKQAVEDLTVSMIIGTFMRARDDYITKARKLPFG